MYEVADCPFGLAYSAIITRPSSNYSIKKQNVTGDAIEVNSQLTMRQFKNVIEKSKSTAIIKVTTAFKLMDYCPLVKILNYTHRVNN